MMKNKYETRTIVILVLISIFIGIAGLLLYNNLSSISNDVKSSYNSETKASLIMRQILTETRTLDNTVKTYNLTNNEETLLSFYNSLVIIDAQLNGLKKRKKYFANEKSIIDSTLLLYDKKVELLKKQLYLEDEKKITNDLNIISDIFEKPYLNHSNETKKPDKKSGFFKRFLKKNNLTNDTLTKTISQLKKKEEQLDKIEVDVKNTVRNVKTSQINKLNKRREEELKLGKESKEVMDALRTLYLKMEAKEKQEADFKINIANKKMAVVKTLSVSVSIFISFLLLVVCYFIFDFNRKKREYEVALLKAKENAEDLVKTKELFLANMSHEIKTPLNAIYGFTEQVLDSDIHPKQKEQLIIVRNAANNLKYY